MEKLIVRPTVPDPDGFPYTRRIEFRVEADDTYTLQDCKMTYTVETQVNHTFKLPNVAAFDQLQRHVRLTPNPIESASNVHLRLNNCEHHHQDLAYPLLQSLDGGDVDEYAEAKARKYYYDNPNSYLPGQRRADHPVRVVDGMEPYFKILGSVSAGSHDVLFNGTQIGIITLTSSIDQEVALTFPFSYMKDEFLKFRSELQTDTVEIHGVTSAYEFYFRVANPTLTHSVSHRLKHPILSQPMSLRYLSVSFDTVPLKLVEADNYHGTDATYTTRILNPLLQFNVLPRQTVGTLTYPELRTRAEPVAAYPTPAEWAAITARGTTFTTSMKRIAQCIPGKLYLYLRSEKYSGQDQTSREQWGNRVNTRLAVVTALTVKTPMRTYFQDYDQHALYDMSRQNGSAQLEKHFRSTLGSLVIIDLAKDMLLEGPYPFHYEVTVTYRRPLDDNEGAAVGHSFSGVLVDDDKWVLHVTEAHRGEVHINPDGR